MDSRWIPVDSHGFRKILAIKDFNDVDIFLIRGQDYNPEIHEEEVKTFIISRLKKSIPKELKYFLFLNKSYLSICLDTKEEEKEQISIQINFRTCYTVEELLCFFDLDCCRFAYDGEKVMTTREGIRFLNIGYNYIDERQKNICFRNRLEKYRKRGIDTIYTDSDRYHHPLLLFFSDEELKALTFPVSFSKLAKNPLPDSSTRKYWRPVDEEINWHETTYINAVPLRHCLYYYPLTNFPITFDSLKSRWKNNKDFHTNHECFFVYDTFSYFIMDNFDHLDNYPHGIRHYARNAPLRKMMKFRYYFFFMHGNKYTSSLSRNVRRELKMLNFKFCSKCQKYYIKSEVHSCI